MTHRLLCAFGTVFVLTALDASAHGSCTAYLTPLPKSLPGASAQIKVLATGRLVDISLPDVVSECDPFEVTVGRIRAEVHAGASRSSFECATFTRCPVHIAGSFAERARSFYERVLGASRGDYDVDSGLVLPWGRILDASSLRRADAKSAQGTFWRLDVTEQPGKVPVLQREGKGESFDLPGDAFQPGKSYTWTFVSGAATVRHTFTLLGEEEAARVRARIAETVKTAATEPMDQTRRWQLIEAYAAEELLYEAAWYRADILRADAGAR